MTENLRSSPSLLTTSSTSRLPCSVFCICQLTEQEVVTPYTRRNFVNGTSTARKGLFDWFFLQKRHSIYISPAQKQLTGRKMDKNPPKKGVFLAPLASWLSLSVSVAQQIRTNSVCPYLLRNIYGQTQPAGQRGKKNTFFWRVFAHFSPCSLILGLVYVHGRDILKRKRSYLAFFGRRDH